MAKEIHSRIFKAPYRNKYGEKKYVAKWYIEIKNETGRYRMPAFENEYKSRELALKIEQRLYEGWDNLGIEDLGYWSSLPKRVRKLLRSKKLLNIPEIVLRMEGLRRIPLDLIRIPHIYFLLNKGEVVYVGKSVRVAKRVTSHDVKGEKQYDEVFAKPCPNMDSKTLCDLESYYIAKYKPIYNMVRNPNRITPKHQQTWPKYLKNAVGA